MLSREFSDYSKGSMCCVNMSFNVDIAHYHKTFLWRRWQETKAWQPEAAPPFIFSISSASPHMKGQGKPGPLIPNMPYHRLKQCHPLHLLLTLLNKSMESSVFLLPSQVRYDLTLSDTIRWIFPICWYTFPSESHNLVISNGAEADPGSADARPVNQPRATVKCWFFMCVRFFSCM